MKLQRGQRIELGRSFLWRNREENTERELVFGNDALTFERNGKEIVENEHEIGTFPPANEVLHEE